MNLGSDEIKNIEMLASGLNRDGAREFLRAENITLFKRDASSRLSYARRCDFSAKDLEREMGDSRDMRYKQVLASVIYVLRAYSAVEFQENGRFFDSAFSWDRAARAASFLRFDMAALRCRINGYKLWKKLGKMNEAIYAAEIAVNLARKIRGMPASRFRTGEFETRKSSFGGVSRELYPDSSDDGLDARINGNR